MRWSRAATLCTVVTMSAAGCSLALPAEPRTPVPVVLPAAPTVPQGAVPLPVAGALDRLAAAPLDLEVPDLEAVGASGDAQLAWLLVDLLRFQPNAESDPPLLGGLRRLTGYEVVNNTRTVAWVAYADALLRWDTPAPPGYLGWKRQIYVAIEPGWAPFFGDAAEVDWRQVTWGGVLRDTIPDIRLDAGGLAARRTDGPDLPASQSFWFAWSQFHPGTLLWRAP